MKYLVISNKLQMAVLSWEVILVLGSAAIQLRAQEVLVITGSLNLIVLEPSNGIKPLVVYIQIIFIPFDRQLTVGIFLVEILILEKMVIKPWLPKALEITGL